MFDEAVSSGKHMICDFKNIKNIELLNNSSRLNIVLKEICKTYNFQILNEIQHSFQPIGCSIIFLLSESHISIHTFPEKNHMAFDIYTCRQYKDNEDYINIFKFLLDRLDASSDSNCKIINRFF